MANELQKQIMYRDPSAVAAAEAARARIESAYLMALNKPRDYDESRDRILHACKRPVFAERVEFSKPVGGRSIKGPSIRFAELALREWRNVLSDIQVLYEDDMVRRVRVMVLDLETNTSFSKEIQVMKTVERKKAEDREIMGERTNTQGQKVYIVRATDDEIHNKEAAMISKVLRNEGLRLIPSDIIDEAIDTARETLRDRDKKDPDAAKKKILDAFSEIGVKPRDLQQYLGHPTDSLNPKELEDLRSIYRAIKDGEARWADYIQTEEDEKAKEKQTVDPDMYAPKNGTDSPKPTDPPPTNEEHSCPHCAFKTATERGLKKHITQSHKQAPPPSDDDEEVEENPTGEPGGTIEPPPSDDDEKIEIRIREVLDSIPKADSGIFESVGFQEFCRKRAKELTNYMELIAPYPSASDVPAGKRGGVLRKLVEAKIKSEG